MKGYLDIKQDSFASSQGPVGLPILYYNTSVVIAYFLVDIDLAQALLPVGLEASPAPLLRKKAIASVVFFHYADSSVGPYNEMALAIVCRPSNANHKKAASIGLKDLSNLSTYIVDLPVTTPLANAAGREIWGYPKIVVPIEFALRGEALLCAVKDSHGGLLCQLQGTFNVRNIAIKAPSIVTFSHLNQQLLQAEIDFKGKLHNSRVGSVKLVCGDGKHHLVNHLRHLKLDGKAPFLISHGMGLQAILSAGKPI